ncbi:MAG: VCBS repeat-containing protein [Candidatus Eisenbacteria bacterium]
MNRNHAAISTLLLLTPLIATTVQAQSSYFGPDCYYSTPATQLGQLRFADFDEDGALDAVVAKRYEHKISWLRGAVDGLGNPTGGFEPEVEFVVTGNPIGLVVADFDGDGHIDMASSTQLPSQVAILLGNGDGTFQTPLYHYAGPATSTIVAEDFDNDGTPDLLVADSTTGNSKVALFLGDGDGTFTFSDDQYFGDRTGYDHVVTHDWNDDGNLDLVVGSSNGSSVTVMFGDGIGGLTLGNTYGAGWFGLAHLSSGDINGDSYLDLVATSNNSHAYTVFLGGANGTFTSTPHVVSGWYYPSGSAIHDVTDDGVSDLVICDYGLKLIYVLEGDGTGTFTQVETFTHPGSPVTGSPARFVDLNADGYEDFALQIGTGEIAVQMYGTANPCALEAACCFGDGSCAILTEVACTAAYGVFHSTEPSCDPNPCPPPLGACCVVDGYCCTKTELDCAALFGDWTTGAPCSPIPCDQPAGTETFSGPIWPTLEDTVNVDGSRWYWLETDCLQLNDGGKFSFDILIDDWQYNAVQHSSVIGPYFDDIPDGQMPAVDLRFNVHYASASGYQFSIYTTESGTLGTVFGDVDVPYRVEMTRTAQDEVRVTVTPHGSCVPILDEVATTNWRPIRGFQVMYDYYTGDTGHCYVDQTEGRIDFRSDRGGAQYSWVEGWIDNLRIARDASSVVQVDGTVWVISSAIWRGSGSSSLGAKTCSRHGPTRTVTTSSRRSTRAGVMPRSSHTPVSHEPLAPSDATYYLALSADVTLDYVPCCWGRSRAR